jgi:hypothetical protein
LKRIGPELKMPKFKGGETKMPPFLVDLYQDLRDRRLLPIVGLLLVAIVAVPILLNSSHESAPVSRSPLAEGSASTSADTLQVVRAEPGLRNYKKRLRRRKPVDPFHQRFTGADLKGAQLQMEEPAPAAGSSETTSTSTGSSATVGSETTVTASPDGSGEGPSGDHNGHGNGGNSADDGIPDGATFFTLEVDLQITRIETKPDGTVDRKGPTLYEEVQAPAPLPGEKTPVITYLGMGSKGRTPMFLVSNEVTAIFGEANCISGGGTCQLLSFEEGFPVTFVYGDNDVRYKVSLLNAEPVVTGDS